VNRNNVPVYVMSQSFQRSSRPSIYTVMLTRLEHSRPRPTDQGQGHSPKAKAKAIPVGNEAGTVPSRTAIADPGK